MTREEAINKWIIPAIKNTWNEKKCNEILKTLEQEPCSDCISREAVSKLLNDGWLKGIYPSGAIMALPPVTPQPKMGKWIVDDSYNVRNFGKAVYHYSVHCKDCGWHWDYSTDKEGSLPSNYCPNCGCKMQEVEG